MSTAALALSQTRVREYASSTLVSVRPEASLTDVHAKLLEHDISAVPVLGAHGELVGIVSTTDLLREARIEIAAPGDHPTITPGVKLAGDIMRHAVLTVDEEASLDEAARTMATHRVHRLVVTRGHTPVGVLATRDLMRVVLRRKIDTPLEQVMTTPVETIDEGETIRTAIRHLDDANLRGLVVVDGTWPVGVFTHTEAIHARALPPSFLDSPVGQVMSYETICLDVATPIYRVAGHALQMRVRRILAVHKRELRGIVSGFDLVRVLVT